MKLIKIMKEAVFRDVVVMDIETCNRREKMLKL